MPVTERDGRGAARRPGRASTPSRRGSSPTASGEGGDRRLHGRLAARTSPVEVVLEEVEPGRPNLLAPPAAAPAADRRSASTPTSDTVGYANWRDRALEPERDGDRLDRARRGRRQGVLRDRRCSRCAQLATSGTGLRGDLARRAARSTRRAPRSARSDLVRRHTMTTRRSSLEPDALGRGDRRAPGLRLDRRDRPRQARPTARRPRTGIDAIVHMAEVVRRPRTGSTREVFPRRRSAQRPDGLPHRHDPGRHRLRDVPEPVRPGDRDRHAARRAPRRSGPRDRGDLRRGAARPSRTSAARSDVRIEREPFLAEGHEALLAASTAATEAVIGRPLEPDGLNAWTDAALMQAAGIPTILARPARRQLPLARRVGLALRVHGDGRGDRADRRRLLRLSGAAGRVVRPPPRWRLR